MQNSLIAYTIFVPKNEKYHAELMSVHHLLHKCLPEIPQSTENVNALCAAASSSRRFLGTPLDFISINIEDAAHISWRWHLFVSLIHGNPSNHGTKPPRFDQKIQYRTDTTITAPAASPALLKIKKSCCDVLDAAMAFPFPHRLQTHSGSSVYVLTYLPRSPSKAIHIPRSCFFLWSNSSCVKIPCSFNSASCLSCSMVESTGSATGSGEGTW